MRTNEDDRYFTDRIQAMPADGYTRMFERMLGRPGIDVMLDTDFESVRERLDYDRVVYTGPVDEYFGRRFGALPYRSLEFRFTTLPEARVLPTATVNFPDESIPFTRITEFTQLTGQQLDRSTLVLEYPRATGDPYYPIPRPENAELYARYKQLADAQSDAIFVGRLATYRYYNMDQVVAQALSTADRITRAGERAA
jgi:UDP-galactopyranose mutase